MSKLELSGIHMYLSAREVETRLNILNRGSDVKGAVMTVTDRSALDPGTDYVHTIVWNRPDYTLIVDFYQYKYGKEIRDAATGLNVHYHFRTSEARAEWQQKMLVQFGAESQKGIFAGGGTLRYFCSLRDAHSCDGEKAILIMGDSFLLLSDCGYIDRATR